MSKNPEKRALVSGAAGFIGSHLVERLLADGYQVLGLDDLSLGRKSNLAAAERHADFRLAVGDVADAGFVRGQIGEAFGGASNLDVWHLAANSDIAAGVKEPDVDLKRTYLTTHGVLAACRGLPVGRILFASTSAVYGEMANVMHETSGPLLPISGYGAMKLASEGAISAFVEGSGATAVIFRFPNVVGPKSTHGILHDFCNRLESKPKTLKVLGNGTQEKQYLHVSELIEAMLTGGAGAGEKRRIFNIGVADSTTTVRAIAELFQKIVAPALPLEFGTEDRGWVGDVPKFRLDTTAIRALGWRPMLESTAAVERAIRELKAERCL